MPLFETIANSMYAIDEAKVAKGKIIIDIVRARGPRLTTDRYSD